MKMLTTATRKIKIGPQHHGRKMSLKAFEFAKTEDGYHYELSRGFIIVSEVANFYHACVVALIRDILGAYRLAHPDDIKLILNSMETKLVILEWESERHPDIAVYLTRPKGPKDRTMWRTWVPELVMEVISASSDHRDYVEKREEYWTLGVKEYWIVDARREQIAMLRRGRSQWKETILGPADTCETKLLPGFRLPCQPVFDAAGDHAGDDD